MIWMARDRITPEVSIGQTDELGNNIVEDSVEMHLMGIDLKLTHRFRGRHFRLTDVSGNIVKRLLAC